MSTSRASRSRSARLGLRPLSHPHAQACELVRATAGGCCEMIDLFLADKLDAAAGVRQPLDAYAKAHPECA